MFPGSPLRTTGSTGSRRKEVARLLALGATPHARTPEPGEDFVVLQDPMGNLFCVVDTRVE